MAIEGRASAPATVEVISPAQEPVIALTEQEAAEIQEVLDKLNEVADQIIASQDRIHLLMREMIDEL